RVAARAIDDLLRGREETYDQLPPLDHERVHLEYYDPRLPAFTDPATCAAGCASCGACRDCGLCETLCPQNAITRRALEGETYEYVVNSDLCIGCGFCAGACPDQADKGLGAAMKLVEDGGALLAEQQRKDANFVVDVKFSDVNFMDFDRAEEMVEAGALAANRDIKAAQESLILHSLPRLWRRWTAKEAKK
ncbi:MAG: 4Fe-4S dicluster domain-containing protein, partial [candidate division NC10 bacterium]